MANNARPSVASRIQVSLVFSFASRLVPGARSRTTRNPSNQATTRCSSSQCDSRPCQEWTKESEREPHLGHPSLAVSSTTVSPWLSSSSRTARSLGFLPSLRTAPTAFRTKPPKRHFFQNQASFLRSQLLDQAREGQARRARQYRSPAELRASRHTRIPARSTQSARPWCAASRATDTISWVTFGAVSSSAVSSPASLRSESEASSILSPRFGITDKPVGSSGSGVFPRRPGSPSSRRPRCRRSRRTTGPRSMDVPLDRRRRAPPRPPRAQQPASDQVLRPSVSSGSPRSNGDLRLTPTADEPGDDPIRALTEGPRSVQVVARTRSTPSAARRGGSSPTSQCSLDSSASYC